MLLLRSKRNTLICNMAEHDKKRLGVKDAKRRGQLQEGTALANLKKLRTIDILSTAKLGEIETDLAGLKICYDLKKEDLKQHHLCKCGFSLDDHSKNVFGQLDNIENRIDSTLEEWAKTLLDTISDPLVAGSKEYLSADQKKVVEDFISMKEFPEKVDDFFVKAISQLLQGFEPVVIDADEMVKELEALPPMDEAGFLKKLTEMMAEYTKGKDMSNRWMTVEFHNSKNAVWNAIQESLLRAGFVIADVRTLDKKQGSFNQIVSDRAVKQDLVISVYKPLNKFANEIERKVGSEETAWIFVRQHLGNIPVVVKNGKIEIIAERQAFLLFDRIVAYHIMRGMPIPMDATDFYKGLEERFLKRDNMYFLQDQINEYDTTRIKNDVEPIQFSLFVTNEKTAIAWLYQQLENPQTYAELQPKFMQEVKSVDKYEEMPELAILLEENFIQDEKGCWYIPDVTKEGDVAKLRGKKLWKEFEGYLNSKGKLKLFRSEAIRVGFARLWKDKNYKAIVDIAERLPEQTIQVYYDISLGRI